MAIKTLQEINKRPRYFGGQYLLQDDFELEQEYFRDRLQRYTRSLHVAGIANGLMASKLNKLAVEISAGTAIDPQGRQIVLIKSRQVDLSKNLVETVIDYILSIGYDEEESEPQDATNTSSNQRILENPIFKLSTSSPSEDWIAIAKLTIKDGNVSIPTDSNSVRQYTGLRLPSSSDNPLTLRSGGDRASSLAVLSGSLSVTDKVGIGTATPTEKLEISGGNLKVSGNISATGNVGIGTTDPKQQLVVNSGKASIGYNDAQQTATFAVNGNVGIGTTTPSGFQIVLPESSKGSSPLVSAGVTIAGGASGNASIELRNAGTGTPYIDFAQNATTTDYDARIRLTEPGKLAIEGANVGIGATSPSAKLTIQIDGKTTAASLKLEHNGSNFIVRPASPGGASSVIENTSGGGSLLINPDGGKVTIGTASSISSISNGKLEIAGISGDVFSAGVPLASGSGTTQTITNSTANIDLSGHVQLKEHGGDGLAYLQARDDRFNRDIGLIIRTQKQSSSGTRTLVKAMSIEADGSINVAGSIKSSGTSLIKDIRAGIYNGQQGAGDIGGGWVRLAGDLNQGGGGKYIYLEILRT